MQNGSADEVQVDRGQLPILLRRPNRRKQLSQLFTAGTMQELEEREGQTHRPLAGASDSDNGSGCYTPAHVRSTLAYLYDTFDTNFICRRLLVLAARRRDPADPSPHSGHLPQTEQGNSKKAPTSCLASYFVLFDNRPKIRFPPARWRANEPLRLPSSLRHSCGHVPSAYNIYGGAQPLVPVVSRCMFCWRTYSYGASP